MSAERAPDGGNRAAITVCVILATLMQALDTTIANVALPYMQGSVSASQDQIAWVLTSYIVAAAIMTPPTGYLAGRFGLKRLFLVSVAGFTVASMLCGMAQSLMEIVLFRVLQGLFGAALVPLSQTMLININPKERQGSAMALWGIAVMAGPVLGPVLGGWLTEAYSWRYVFYINLPIGALAFLGMTAFLPESARNAGEKLDWFGFGTLSLAIGAMQVAIDRGEQLDWFGSSEIVTAGLVLGPRGVGTMGAMLVVGKLIGRVDTRLLLAIGLGLTAWSFYAMTAWTPDVSQMTIIVVGVIQGVGLGFIFVPLSTVTLSTLSPELRAEGAGIFSLSRNICSSVGISLVNALLTRNTQINHAEIAQHVTAVNRMFEEPMVAKLWNPATSSSSRRRRGSVRITRKGWNDDRGRGARCRSGYAYVGCRRIAGYGVGLALIRRADTRSAPRRANCATADAT